jgi:hypothetical protein
LLLMVPYMFWSGLGHVFVLQRSTLSGVGMYEHLRLAVPGLFCQLLEWASMELVTIIAGTYIRRHSAHALLSHTLLVCLRCQQSCATLSL